MRQTPSAEGAPIRKRSKPCRACCWTTSAGCFIQAMKEGVKGKVVGHKLTYPILCEWMHEQDKRVEEYNYNQYLANR